MEEQKNLCGIITYITYTDIEIQPIPNSCANFNQKLALSHLKFRPLFKIWEVQMIPCSNSTSKLIGRVLIFPPFLCITRIQSGTTFGFFWTVSILLRPPLLSIWPDDYRYASCGFPRARLCIDLMDQLPKRRRYQTFIELDYMWDHGFI